MSQLDVLLAYASQGAARADLECRFAGAKPGRG